MIGAQGDVATLSYPGEDGGEYFESVTGSISIPMVGVQDVRTLSQGTGRTVRIAYPSLPVLATSSARHHARLTDLGATYVGDYKSSSVVADMKAASTRGVGVDAILDCVSAGASQTDIYDVFDLQGSKKYAAVMTGIPVTVPNGVNKVDVSMSSVLDMQGGMQVFPSLTKLVEDGIYRVSLPVRVVGHGLEELGNVLYEVMAASGEKVVMTL